MEAQKGFSNAEEILKNFPFGIVVADLNRTIYYCNQHGCEIIGNSYEDIIDRNLLDIISFSEIPDFLHLDQNLTLNAKINGKSYISIISPIRRQNETIAISVILQDASDIEQLNARIKDMESLLTSWEMIFENAYDGVIVTDKNGIVTRITNAYCKFLGITQQDAIGNHVTKVLPNSRMHIVTQTGKAEIGELMDINGKEAVVMRIPLRQNGEVIGAVGKVMFHNIDEVRSLAEKLNILEQKVKYYEGLQQSYTSKYTFNDIIGESPEFRKAKELAQRVAPGKSTVLLLGESGSGKELLRMRSMRRAPGILNRLFA